MQLNIYKKIHSQAKTYKNIYKLLIMSRVSCNDEFLLSDIKTLIFFFMIHEATRYTRYQSYRQQKGDTIEMKSKL